MKEYKMRQGETLDERNPSLRESIESSFGSIRETTELDGHEVFVVEEPDNPVFERVLVGPGRYSNKKDTLLVEFEERPAKNVVAEGLTEAAEEAIEVKNEFLLEVTGRDAEARRKSLKRDVEDSNPDI